MQEFLTRFISGDFLEFQSREPISLKFIAISPIKPVGDSAPAFLFGCGDMYANG